MNQALFQGVQIFRVWCAILKAYILIRGRFWHRIIVFLMDRERINAGVIREDRRRAVAMMHIGVHGHGRSDRPSGLKCPDRDGYVVEHAKPFAMPGIRMVETASEVCGESILNSITPRQDRSPRRQEESLHGGL